MQFGLQARQIVKFRIMLGRGKDVEIFPPAQANLLSIRDVGNRLGNPFW